MTVEQVRTVIAEMTAHTKSKAARIAMAKAAIRFGKVDEAGRAVWREYLASEENS